MKLNRREAKQLFDTCLTDDPGSEERVLQRIMNHEWSFDPRAGRLKRLLRHFHEQEQVLYDRWETFTKTTSPKREWNWCCLCSNGEFSHDFYTAKDYRGISHICGACAAALQGIEHHSAPQPATVSRKQLSAHALSEYLRRLRHFFWRQHWKLRRRLRRPNTNFSSSDG